MKYIATYLLLIVMNFPLYGQWESMDGPEGGAVGSIYQNSSFYFIGTSHGIYRSVTGDQWEQLKLDIPKLYSIRLISVTDSILYVSFSAYHHQTDSSLLFRSVDQGETWIQLVTPHLYDARGLYALNQTVIYSGLSELYTGPDSLWISHDAGNTWQISALTPVAEHFYDIYGSEESVIITAIGSKEFRFYPETDTWTEAGLPDSIYYQTIFEFDSIWFAFTAGTGLMYRSDDDGHHWIQVSTKNWDDGYPIMTQTANAMYMFSFNALYKSIDKGLTWTITSITDFDCNAMHPAPNGLYVSNANGLFLLSEPDLSITPSYSGIVASRVGNLHLQEDQLWFTSSGHNISRLNTTTNAYEFDLYGGNAIEDIVTLDGRIFALQDGTKVIRSNDNGATWKSASPPQLYSPFYQLFSDNHKLYLGGTNYPFTSLETLVSEDYGSHWTTFESIIWPYSQPYLFARKSNLFFAASKHIIYRSNQDQNWESISMENYSSGEIVRLYASDNILIVVFFDSQQYQTFISSDDGDTWKEITFNPTSSDFRKGFNEFVCIGNNIIGTNNQRPSDIYISTDLGDSWKLFNQGFYSHYIDGFEVDDQYIYLASYGQGLWRRKISDIKTVSTDYFIPENKLMVFPNPSNGVLSFQSDVNSITKAKLSITDITGKVIWFATRTINPGINTIETSIEQAGIYLITISTDSAVKTGKFIIQ